jgi:TonB family protein
MTFKVASSNLIAPSIFGVAFCLSAGAIVSGSSTPVPQSGTTSEALLRQSAIFTVRPIYPEADRKSAIAGVAVAAVTLTESGSVKRVTVLQAPSPSIAASVKNAIFQWRFKPSPPIDSRPISLTAKLTFYFLRQDRKYSVLNPSEAAYIGRRSSTHARSQPSFPSPGTPDD